jgi:hypothetical protein
MARLLSGAAGRQAVRSSETFPRVLPVARGNRPWCHRTAGSVFISGARHQNGPSSVADRCPQIYIGRGAGASRHDGVFNRTTVRQDIKLPFVIAPDR